MFNFVQVQASGPWGLRPGGEDENFNHPDKYFIGTGIHTLSILRIALKLHFVQNVESDIRAGGKRGRFSKVSWRCL
jgi:hypothetical protein